MNAKDGKLLWNYDRLGNNTANIPTPVVLKDHVFSSAGYGKGGALLKLTATGNKVEATEGDSFDSVAQRCPGTAAGREELFVIQAGRGK